MGSPGNGNDECFTGQAIIFNPSSFNTTSALTGFSFKMSAGNVGSGRIALYGIK